MRTLAVAFACLGCAGARDAPASEATKKDDGPCARLCADEASCGSTEKTCRATCVRDEAILRSEVVTAIVACRIDALKTTCAGAQTAFTRGDLLADTRCLSIALGKTSAGDANRRAWSEASCDRMLRCQAKDVDVASVRPICVAATMQPKEQEEREAMLVVDALKPSVIDRWDACLKEGACPDAGKSDEVAEKCLANALERSAK